MLHGLGNQEAKRDAEQKAWFEKNKANQEYYLSKVERLPDHWDLRDKSEINPEDLEPEDPNSGGYIKSGVDADTKPPQYGIYSYNHGEGNEKKYTDDFNILYDEEFGVRPIPPKMMFDEKAWDAAMDFVKAKLKSDTAKIYLPAHPASPRSAEIKLYRMMFAAGAINMSVDLDDPKTKTFITSLSVKKQGRIFAYKALLDGNRDFAKMAMGQSDNEGLTNCIMKLNEQKKLEGINDTTKKNNLKDAIYKDANQNAITDITQKAEITLKEIDALKKRMEIAQGVGDRISDGMKTQKKFIDNPVDIEKMQEKVVVEKSKFSSRTPPKKALKKALRGMERSHDGQRNGLDSLSKLSDSSALERTGALDELKKELADLRLRSEALKEALDALKLNPPLTPTSTDDEKARHKKMNEGLEDLKKIEDDLTTRITQHEEAMAWEGIPQPGQAAAPPPAGRKEAIIAKKEKIEQAEQAEKTPTLRAT